MKFTSIIFTTLVTIAFVEGAAIPDSILHADHGFCYRPSEVCSKLKRAADAAAEAIADPQSCDGFCYRPGEVCSKAKRDALALAEATAEALAAADPDSHPCHAPGAPCSVTKREALHHCESQKRAPTMAKSEHGQCYRAGEVCPKLKRAAEAVAEALALPNQIFQAEFESWHGSSNQKRAVDDVNGLLDRILVR